MRAPGDHVSRETSSPADDRQLRAAVLRATTWAGLRLSRPQVEQLSVFRRWLEEEAIAAGGIGPGEGERVLDRHVSDSLVFAGAWPGTQPDTLIDVGSGVGLPGIPLAVAMPATRLTLLDRSARRCSLARRAIRILGLENVEVVHSDVGAVRRTFGVVTFRASLAPAEALRVGKRLIDPGGTVVVAASRVQRPTEWHGDLVDIVTVPAGVLDSPAWLLRMRDNPSED